MLAFRFQRIRNPRLLTGQLRSSFYVYRKKKQTNNWQREKRANKIFFCLCATLGNGPCDIGTRQPNRTEMRINIISNKNILKNSNKNQNNNEMHINRKGWRERTICGIYFDKIAPSIFFYSSFECLIQANWIYYEGKNLPYLNKHFHRMYSCLEWDRSRPNWWWTKCKGNKRWSNVSMDYQTKKCIYRPFGRRLVAASATSPHSVDIHVYSLRILFVWLSLLQPFDLCTVAILATLELQTFTKQQFYINAMAR